VEAAPASHEAHAVLGLIYDRRSNAEQALREYREALSLSPEDSLARLGLGTSGPSAGSRVREIRRVLTGQSDLISFSTADTGDSLREIAQAMLRDPSVLHRIFKPGVTTEVAPSLGSQSTYALGLTHRDQYARGELHDLSFGSQEWSKNYRNDRPERSSLGWVNLVAAPDYRIHVLGQYVYTGRVQAFPGSLSQPTPGDRSSLSDNSWDLSTRFQIAPATFLWLHAANRMSSSFDRIENPQQDSFNQPPPFLVSSRTPYRQLGIEGRLDHQWGGGHTSSYSLFAGGNNLDNTQLGFSRDTVEFGQKQIFVRDRLTVHTFQHDYSPGGRLAVILGVTAERFTDRFRIVEPGQIVLRGQDTVNTRWNPYGQATYLLGRRDLVRVIGHHRRELGFSTLLQPAEAFQVSEFPSLQEGRPQTTSWTTSGGSPEISSRSCFCSRATWRAIWSRPR
jgi:hypothetical protein